MYRAEFDIGKGPEYWPEAETILKQLLVQDPTYLEPAARYAKLLTLQGRVDEAEVWMQRVLDSKPWHIVTLETRVALAAIRDGRHEKNPLSLQLYQSRRLPPPSKVEARKQWVDQALKDAQVVLGHMMQKKDEEEQTPE
mgnify:CR=1 FL=1